MKNDLKKLHDYLRSIPSEAPSITGEELLEQLWLFFAEEYPVENAAVRAAFLEVDGVLEPLGLNAADRVTAITCRLCWLCERAAFLEGLRLGVQLSVELL